MQYHLNKLKNDDDKRNISKQKEISGGFISETGLARNAPKIAQKLVASRFSKWVATMVEVTRGDLQSSGASLGEIATEARFANSSGKYFQATRHKLSEQKSSVISYDERLAKKLWIDSDELLKAKIGALAVV